jgi:hypothetical protein
VRWIEATETVVGMGAPVKNQEAPMLDARDGLGNSVEMAEASGCGRAVIIVYGLTNRSCGS